MLVFDKDRLTDEHLTILRKSLLRKKQLPNFALPLYTQETVFLTDLHMLAMLLSASYEAVATKSLEEVESALRSAMQIQESMISKRYETVQNDNHFIQEYKGCYLNKLNQVFSEHISISDIDLAANLQSYYDSQPAIHLANKDDVIAVVNKTFSDLGVDIVVDEDVFYCLLQHCTSATMYPQWEEMVKFIEGEK